MAQSQLFLDNLKRLNESFVEKGMSPLSEQEARDFDLDYDMDDEEIDQIAHDLKSELASDMAALKNAWRYEC